jgi:hypothetical protein
MREFNQLIADTERIYREQGDRSIICLVRELSVLDLEALVPEREALVEKIESLAYLTKVSGGETI